MKPTAGTDAPTTGSFPWEAISHPGEILRSGRSLPRGDSGSQALPFPTQSFRVWAPLHPHAGWMAGAEVARGGLERATLLFRGQSSGARAMVSRCVLLKRPQAWLPARHGLCREVAIGGKGRRTWNRPGWPRRGRGLQAADGAVLGLRVHREEERPCLHSFPILTCQLLLGASWSPRALRSDSVPGESSPRHPRRSAARPDNGFCADWQRVWNCLSSDPLGDRFPKTPTLGSQ